MHSFNDFFSSASIVLVYLPSIFLGIGTTMVRENELTKILPELISEFSRVTGYKVSIQKSTLFLYTSYKLVENEIWENIYNSINKLKYWRMKMRTDMKDLYTENYKTLISKIKDDLKMVMGWKTQCC